MTAVSDRFSLAARTWRAATSSERNQMFRLAMDSGMGAGFSLLAFLRWSRVTIRGFASCLVSFSSNKLSKQETMITE